MINEEKRPVNPFVENRLAAIKAEQAQKGKPNLNEPDLWADEAALDADIEAALNFLVQLPDEARKTELGLWQAKHPEEADRIGELLEKRLAA